MGSGVDLLHGSADGGSIEPIELPWPAYVPFNNELFVKYTTVIYAWFSSVYTQHSDPVASAYN